MLKAEEFSGNLIFEEKQKYPRWITWLIRGAMLLAVLGMVIGLVTGKEKREMIIAVIIVIPAAAIVLYLSSNAQLEKIVTSNGLYYRWRPWNKKYRVIEKGNIESIRTRRFPFKNYGFGWFPGFGFYHNASSGEGLQLTLKNGRNYFFSTGNKASFGAALRQLISPDR
jgi:hypothetical protein